MRKFRITTPERVSFHFTVAGPIARCLAWLTDQLFLWIGYLIIAFTFAQLGSPLGYALMLLGIFVLDFGYFIYFELRWAGQTPGKRRFQIRVISARGSRLRFADVLVRNLMRPIDMLPFAMVLGGSVCIVGRWHRRLGDLVADTIIIRDVRRTLPQAMASEQSRVNTFQIDPALRNRILIRVTRPQRDLILDLAIRRDQIDIAARQALFSEAAGYLRNELALPENVDYLSDEQVVVNLALVIQDAKFTA